MKSHSCIQSEFRGLAPSFTSTSQPEPDTSLVAHLLEWSPVLPQVLMPGLLALTGRAMLPHLVLEFGLNHSLGQARSHIPGSHLNVASWLDSWLKCGPLYHMPNFHQLEASTSHHWLADSQAAGCAT